MNSTVFTDITAYLDSRGRAEQCYGSTWGAMTAFCLKIKDGRDSFLMPEGEASAGRLEVGINRRAASSEKCLMMQQSHDKISVQ